MRKVLLSMLAVALLGAGSAFAQSPAMGVQYATTQYAGVGIGYPFQVYYGMENMLGDNLDLRVRLSSYFWNISLGADVIYDVAYLDSAPVRIYVGGGPNLDMLFLGGINSFGVGISGLGGAEYRFDENWGAFAELGIGYTFYFGNLAGLNAFGLGFAPRGALGVNYHF